MRESLGPGVCQRARVHSVKDAVGSRLLCDHTFEIGLSEGVDVWPSSCRNVSKLKKPRFEFTCHDFVNTATVSSCFQGEGFVPFQKLGQLKGVVRVFAALFRAAHPASPLTAQARTRDRMGTDKALNTPPDGFFRYLVGRGSEWVSAARVWSRRIRQAFFSCKCERCGNSATQ